MEIENNSPSNVLTYNLLKMLKYSMQLIELN